MLDMAEVPFLDSSASLALEEAIAVAQGRKKEVFVVGVRAEVRRTLDRLEALQRAAELVGVEANSK